MKEIEQFLVFNFNEENLMDIVNLIKGMSVYEVQTAELEDRLFQFINDHLSEFSNK